jgi:hypothetical protein
MKCFYVSLRVEIHSWYDLVDMLEQPMAPWIIDFAKGYLVTGFFAAAFVTDFRQAQVFYANAKQTIQENSPNSTNRSSTTASIIATLAVSIFNFLLAIIIWPRSIYVCAKDEITSTTDSDS